MLSILIFGGGSALANPTGMTVGSGSATASQSGATMTITTSQMAQLNWQTFNIAAGETTIFNQPSASSVVLNRINDLNPSQVFGNLQANGVVVLMNSSGFYFGPNSYVKTGGLIVSTANVTPPPPTGGGTWQFNGPPPAASIINYGKIDVGAGGSAYLIAENVRNYGSINAPGGSIGLAAGQQVLLSDRPDGRGLSVQVTVPAGAVDNHGNLTADAGNIALTARTVNQNGFLQANSVRNVNGAVELVAGDNLSLGANSQIRADGDTSPGGGSGGRVTLQSGNTFSDAAGSRIEVTGGSQGGNGGSVEISAPNVLSLNSTVDALAKPGWTAGTLLLDPGYITLDTTGTGSAGSGTVSAGTSSTSTLDLNVNTAFANLGVSDIILQALNDITLAGGTSWDLSGTIGANLGGVTSGQLTLQAGRNIIFGDGSSISDGNDWSVALAAGVNNFSTGTIQPGVGNIYLNGGAGQTGGGSLQTMRGSIYLTAGQDITVGSGSVITTGGGSITAHALAGNIDTGSDAEGYHFEAGVSSLDQVYDLSGGLGGISTGGGGDVTLVAGGNVTSVLPTVNGYIYDGNFEPANNGDYTTAGAGAYGSALGNVTVVAGGNVTGHYLVANGTGAVYAGVKMDANGNPVTDGSGNYVLGSTGSAGTSQFNPDFSLSLISGGWKVAAAENILLQEVNNPNGVFDTTAGAALNHYFDYVPDDYVNLNAGNLVQLGAPAASLPRATGLAIPFIYPSILNVTAGDGGIYLGTPGSPSSLILFPSPQGGLTLKTPGSLVGNLAPLQGSPQFFNLIVSDSGSRQFKNASSFGLNDHAATPVHLGSEQPVTLNVGGDMDYVLLGSPEAAQISVGGNMNNSRFQGMNLSAGDVISIHVAGDIYNRSTFTDLEGVTPAEAANLFYLGEAAGNSISATTLAGSFYYNPATQTLTYQNISGFSLAAVLNLLNHLTVQQVIAGVPQWADPPYNTVPVPDPNPVSVFGNPSTPGTLANELLARYNALGGIPNNATATGFFLGGGGTFDITARSLDLGTSAGIVSKGVGLYKVGNSYPLAGLFGSGGVFDHGADVSVTTTGSHSGGNTASGDLAGDLDMYSSSIATLNGGNVSIHAGGDVNAGSSVFTVGTLGVRGLYTTSQGDVSVVANGNINVNGSRIATYDGGNVTVESLNGNINAGSGASSPVVVQAYYEDPITHAVYSTTPQIPFSGILALTFPPRGTAYPAPLATLGNILIEAPHGDVNANAAGILQISFNGAPYNKYGVSDASTTILAGYNSNNGHPAYALDDQNIIDLGSTYPLSIGGVPVVDASGQPVTVTPLLHPDGTPFTDASGHPIYRNERSGHLITYTVGDGVIYLYPYLNPSGDPASLVSLPNELDPHGNPIFVVGRNIDVGGSGIVGNNLSLLATGDVNGLIFAGNNLDLVARHSANLVSLVLGNASIAAPQLTGTVSALGSVSVSGDNVTADLISANVSGATSGQSGLGMGGAANGASQGLANSQASQVAAATDQNNNDEMNKKGKQVALAQKVSRVTVILPPKKMSETKTPTPGT